MGVSTRLTRLGSAAVALALIGLVAAPALAAPPGNDTFAGAIPISALPFTTTLDTSEATTDAVDTELNDQCGAPATDASVWYSYTPTADSALVLDMEGSSYEGGFLVATGAPGSFELVACGARAIAFEISAGTTYAIMVLDDQSDGVGNGGTLTFTAAETTPPPDVEVTVNPTGIHHNDGSATVSGTIACSGEVEFSFVGAELIQRVGRGVVYGGNSFEVTCDGVVRPWSVDIFPDLGTKFAGGKAASFSFGVACGPIFCTESFVETIIQLKKR